MRVSATKAPWFVFLWCGFAALSSACRHGSSTADAPLCEDDGVLSSRRDLLPSGAELAAEIVQNSCERCAPERRAGAPPGSPCSAASVCAEFCCECPNTSPVIGYRARVCDSGACANAKAACEEGRKTIRPDPCQPRQR
jgi:hypothetical protein